MPRKGGWDCHGLPVELEIERELGISSKAEIEAYGIAEFNQRCRESVFRYVEDWNRLTERIGFWIDLDDAYRTLDNSYIESVWWALREIWDAGRLYQGHKVVPYCPRCGTALSSHEVAQGYHDVEDPSVFVRMPVRGGPGPLSEGDQLLVWTTTPWTLISNAAIAAGPEIEYVRARPQDSEEVLVVARARLDAVLGEGAEVLDSFPGSAIAGAAYEPPFDYITDYGPRGHTVLEADFVTTGEGTGLVHTAIAFGEDDFRLGEQYGITLQNPVRPDGTFDEQVTDFAGRSVKEADADIVEALRERGRLLRAEVYEHSYPHCWRCDTPLLYIRKGELVPGDDRGPRPDAGREREDRVAPGAHQARPLRQVAGGKPGLGAIARALLGHAAADLALRGQPSARRPSAPGRSPPSRSGRRARSPTTSTGPTSTT